MKSFFKDFNLARGIILASILGCLVLGFLCWQRSQELGGLREDLASRVVPAVKEMVQFSHRHTTLSQSMKGEGLRGEENLQTYIRKVGTKDRIEIGELNMANTETEISKGVVDKKFTIKPDNPKQPFPRMKLVNFFYTLEDDSRRVKLTRVKMEVLDQRGLKTHEVPKDEWTFDCELTSRQRKN